MISVVIIGKLAQWLVHLVYTEVVSGLNPLFPTKYFQLNYFFIFAD